MYPEYNYIGYEKKCDDLPFSFPPQHQCMQPGIEHIMNPLPIFEDEDYVAEEEEATSKRVEPAQGIKPGMKIKRPAGRQPMSKARASTEKPTPIEPVAAEGKKRKEMVKKTVARVLGKASIMEDEEEEEEVAAPTPKAPKLMGDAIRTGAAASKAKPAPKPKPKRNTRSILATASVPPAPASTSASTPTTSTEGFILGVLRTPPPPEDQA